MGNRKLKMRKKKMGNFRYEHKGKKYKIQGGRDGGGGRKGSQLKLKGQKSKVNQKSAFIATGTDCVTTMAGLAQESFHQFSVHCIFCCIAIFMS